jgi:uncharacterized protein
MVASTPRARAASRMRLDDVVVVDLDVHILERAEQLAPYCDRPWRQVLEGGQAVPPFGGAGANVFPNFPGQWEPRASVAFTPAEMRADLDELSIDIALLFPERLLSLPRQPNPEYAMALARAYNRWLGEEYLSRERGFYGGIIAAPQDPLGSAREIERYAGQERMVGVVMPTSGIDVPWGSRQYDPIYEAAEAHGLAVIYHAGGMLRMPMLPFDMRQLDTWFLMHTFSHSIAMMSTVASLFSTAMPARFPKLQIILTEAGLSCFAHSMMRLDWAWEQRRGDVPLLKERPSAYMRRQMFYATQPIEEPDDLKDMADVIRAIGGEDSVVFASDYPHHDFDHPKKVFDIPVSAETKRKIMGENALRALKIPFPSAAQRVPRKADLRAG